MRKEKALPKPKIDKGKSEKAVNRTPNIKIQPIKS